MHLFTASGVVSTEFDDLGGTQDNPWTNAPWCTTVSLDIRRHKSRSNEALVKIYTVTCAPAVVDGFFNQLTANSRETDTSQSWIKGLVEKRQSTGPLVPIYGFKKTVTGCQYKLLQGKQTPKKCSAAEILFHTEEVHN